MHPSLSMNPQAGPVDLNEAERREKAYAAQADSARHHQQAQYARISAPMGYNAPSVLTPDQYEAHVRRCEELRQEAGLRNQANVAAYVADRTGKSQRLGESLGGGIIGQQARVQGKMFSLETLLAVIRSRKAILMGRPHFDEACRELDTLIDIFTRMEA